MKKVPPARVLSELVPPNPSHSFFENWQTQAFMHNAKECELANAWWLAEASLLAYGEKDFVEERFASSGLTQAGFSVTSFSVLNAQCFIANNDEFILAAFRGTQVDSFWSSIMDIATDLKFVPVADGASGFVHHGFLEAISLVWEQFKAHLTSIISDGKPRTIWLTGHSLGAAMATIAADRLFRIMNLPVQGLYTFGSPRVGNGAFSERLSSQESLGARTFRIVNNADVIATVPPEGIYKHVGAMKLIDEHGVLRSIDNQSKIAGSIAKFDLPASVVKSLRSVTGLGGIIHNIPDFIADHAPIYYPIHMWNNCEDQVAR